MLIGCVYLWYVDVFQGCTTFWNSPGSMFMLLPISCVSLAPHRLHCQGGKKCLNHSGLVHILSLNLFGIPCYHTELYAEVHSNTL